MVDLVAAAAGVLGRGEVSVNVRWPQLPAEES
jgi:hypothetical protein